MSRSRLADRSEVVSLYEAQRLTSLKRGELLTLAAGRILRGRLVGGRVFFERRELVELANDESSTATLLGRIR